MGKTRNVLMVALAVTGVGLAACGGSSSTAGSATAPAAAPSAMTAEEIAAKLQPLGCAATPPTSASIDNIGIKPKTELRCTISGENVGIDEYANAEQVSYTMNLAKTVGCSMAKSFGVTGDQDYVLGETTMVTAQTPGTSQAIKNAIGDDVKITVVHCS